MDESSEVINNAPARINTEPEFAGFVPSEFTQDPLGYFEKEGRNIKPGEVKFDETGRVREDPTAVKDLPVWKNALGDELNVVGKRVNVVKGEIGTSGDPFYEYKVMKVVSDLGLPTAFPVAMAEQGDTHLIVMERIPGVRWAEKDQLIAQMGLTESEQQKLVQQVQVMMDELQQRLADFGITRDLKIKDLVFEFDPQTRGITKITPTDWERTKVDWQKVETLKQSQNPG